MNKKTDYFSRLCGLACRLGSSFLLVVLVMLAFAAFAGGSIFGGKNSKSDNPDGVYAIGVHFCSTLECPPIRIIEGICDGENMQKRWGVCLCDEGYVSRDGVCAACPKGQYSDGIHECTGCAVGTYKANEGDTECTPCPSDSYCVRGMRYACPEHATCTSTAFKCWSGYKSTAAACVCAEGKYVNENDACVDCSADEQAAACSGGCITQCKEGYYPDGGVCPDGGGAVCAPCSNLHAAECNGKTGSVIKCEDGYYEVAGECVECLADHYCKDGKMIDCPKHAECSKDDFTCVDKHKKKGDACVCASNRYEDEDGICQLCPDAPSCEGIDCCELTGPEDICGRKTLSLEFKGPTNAYGEFCYPCDKKADMTGVTKEQCDRCEKREYYKVPDTEDEICFMGKCVNGFRDRKYGDCYSCDSEIGIEAEKDQCDLCPNRVMTNGYCSLRCPEGTLLDTVQYTCISCKADVDIHVFDPDKIDCEASCPLVRELDSSGVCVRTCSAHGKKEKHKCVCEDRWYGDECASLCEEVLDKEGNCQKCNVLGRFASTAEECARCVDRKWNESTQYCHLTSCVTDSFRDNDGWCYSCDDMASVETDQAQCNRCTNFPDDPESDALVKRELITRGGKQFCELTSDYCASKGGFKDYYGNCHMCDEANVIGSTSAECNICNKDGMKDYEKRLYVASQSKCYPACGTGAFRDKNYLCRSCDDPESYEAGYEECEMHCRDKREMIAGYCAPKCPQYEIYDMNTMKCVPCITPNIRAPSNSECIRRCAGIREVVDDVCALSCDGHGIKDDNGVCECYPGWFGPKCDSICTGAKDVYGNCHYCVDPNRFNSRQIECDRCSDRWYENAICYPPCDGFMDANNVCHDCDDEEKYTTSAEKCSKCTNRTMVTISGVDYCMEACAEGEFRDYYGVCHSCSENATIGSYSAECAKCRDRDYLGSKCYYTCNGFRDSDNNCHACTDKTNYRATEDSCDENCSEQRETIIPYVERATGTTYCALKCTGFRDFYGTCYSCDTTSNVGTTNAECLRCGEAREYVGDKCYSKCTNGFRDANRECHLCTERTTYQATEASCSQNCSEQRETIIPYVERAAGTTYCALKCTGFRDLYGNCYACNETSTISSTNAECMLCGAAREYIGDKCYPKCEGFRDADKKCHDCEDVGRYELSEEACSACVGAREIITLSGKTYCVAKCGGNEFRDFNGNCHNCNESSAVGSYKAQCDICEERVYDADHSKCYAGCGDGKFMGSDFLCYSCNETSDVATTQIACDACGNMRRYTNGKCVLACDQGFKGTDGICYSCDTTNAIASTRDACNNCDSRSFFSDKCWLSCGTGKFRDGYGTCHDCSDPSTYFSYAIECNKCGDVRKYEGSNCLKK